MGNEAYFNAFEAIARSSHGKVKLYDGKVISGRIIDLQDEINDPLGIGFFTMVDSVTGICADVYADEFEELLEVW